jgi:hypothetical protein
LSTRLRRPSQCLGASRLRGLPHPADAAPHRRGAASSYRFGLGLLGHAIVPAAVRAPFHHRQGRRSGACPRFPPPRLPRGLPPGRAASSAAGTRESLTRERRFRDITQMVALHSTAAEPTSLWCRSYVPGADSGPGYFTFAIEECCGRTDSDRSTIDATLMILCKQAMTTNSNRPHSIELIISSGLNSSRLRQVRPDPPAFAG